MTQRVFTQSFPTVGAILEKDGKILLVKENWGEDIGKWNQPAGWIEPGSNPIESVVNEVKEETGYEFKPTGIIGIYSLVRKDLIEKFAATPHPIKIIFRGEITGGQQLVSNNEIAEVRWFTPDEIEAMDLSQLRDIDIKKEVTDYFAGKNYPLDMIKHTFSE